MTFLRAPLGSWSTAETQSPVRTPPAPECEFQLDALAGAADCFQRRRGAPASSPTKNDRDDSKSVVTVDGVKGVIIFATWTARSRS